MYRLTEGGVIRLIDGSRIPENPDNNDWKAYLEWLSIEGNVPLPDMATLEAIWVVPKHINKSRQIKELRAAILEATTDQKQINLLILQLLREDD